MVIQRKSRRNTHLRRRFLSFWTKEKKIMEKQKKLAMFMMIIASFTFIHQRIPKLIRNFTILSSMLLYTSYFQQSIERPIQIYRIERINKRISDISDSQAENFYRFRKSDLYHLLQALRFPSIFVLDNGCVVNGEEALLIMLYRLAYPCRLIAMQEVFGIEISQISRIFNQTIKYVYTKHIYLLEDNMLLLESRLPVLNDAIRKKVTSMYRNRLIPDRIQNVSVFLDGTQRRVSRPLGSGNVQRNIYCGRKKIHSLAYQGVSGPDGIVYDLFGPVPGRRNDKFVLRESMFIERFRDIQANNVIQYHAYTDKGYESSTYIKSAYRRYAGFELNENQLLENSIMSRCRQGIEWTFGKITEEEKFIDMYKSMKIQLSFIDIYYKVAVLISNAHTCLYGSQLTEAFDIMPPTLREYFRNNEVVV
jgi:nuclease HARBI1